MSLNKKNLALLCDYGLDDAIATLYIFKNADMFGNIDILPVAGNFPLGEVFINAKRIISHCDNLPVNVRIVDTSCISQPEESLPDIHGNDGMGDVIPQIFEEKVPVINYSDWLTEVDETYTVLSLGPCTVTADILRKKGSLTLVMMAGNIAEPPNYNGYEFNHGLNISAFAECVKFPHVAATLDSCHCYPCDLNHLTVNGNDLFSELTEKYRSLSNLRDEKACYVYDLTAAVYVVNPDRFTVEEKEDKDKNLISVLKYTSDKDILSV